MSGINEDENKINNFGSMGSGRFDDKKDESFQWLGDSPDKLNS